MTDASSKSENALEKMGVCRGCMEKIGITDQNLSHELRRMFVACTGLEVTEFDGLPLWVCNSCENKIFYCYEFISCCKKTDVSLREILTECSGTWSCRAVKTEHVEHDVSDGDVKPYKVDEKDSYPAIDYVGVKLETEIDNIGKENAQRKLENKKRKRNDMKTEPKLKKAKIECSSTNGKFVCSHCSKEFAQKAYLKQHISIHNPSEPYICDICNKKYKKLCHLKLHQKIHTGEKPFKCDICDMGFVLKSSLLIHSKQHDGTSHICHLCGLDFTQLGNLKVHMRVHTGEKPYACSKCAYRCSVKSGLRRHERLHSNIRPYSCTVCYKSFNSKSSHSRHNRIHTGELPYKCSYCSKAFIDNWKRKKHLMKTHNIAMTDIPHLSGGRKRIYVKNTRKDENRIS